MTPRWFDSQELRSLLWTIVRTAAASGCVAACASSHENDMPASEERDARVAPSVSPVDVPRDAAAQPTPGSADAQVAPPGVTPLDASAVVTPLDAGTLDAARDATPDAVEPLDAAAARWELLPCDGEVALPTQLKATLPTSYLSVQRSAPAQFGAPDAGIPDVQWEVARIGPGCSGSSSQAACEQELRLLITRGCGATRSCTFALTGSEGAFVRIDRRADLLTLLGSIDAAAEALILAAFDGHGLCAGLRDDPRDIGTETLPTSDGFQLRITREPCGRGLYQQLLDVKADGGLAVLSEMELRAARCTPGRRPAGMCDHAASLPHGAGAYLAESAQLEAASVYAFWQLLRELRTHGAPEALQRAALEAMLDEVEHARSVARLARDYGASVELPRVQETAPRSLFEIALDNVAEGCVRETFGALLATYQAEHARDAEVRAVMAQIAEDETRHAALSWQLMAWLTPRLSETERLAVEVERARSQAGLAQALAYDLSHDEHARLGLPDVEVASRLLAQLSCALS